MVQIQNSMDEAKKQADPQAQRDAAVKDVLGRIKHKFIIMSGKGGVGKTSTSVNLSLALSNLGHKVGIMDVDLHGPDVPRMLGLSGMLELSPERKLKPMPFSENLSAVSIESLTPTKDDAIIWRGPVKYSAIQQFIGDVDWGALDFLLIDAPPGTGDEPLTVAQTIPDAKAIIVTTPQEVSLADVRKSINFCKVVKMEIFGLIENMSGFACPHCQAVIDLFGSGGGEKTAVAAGIPFLGKIPFDSEMVACGDAGVSYQQKHSDSPVSQAFTDVAQKMAGLL
ncbi:Mrp/NBP35 family ATP-binding protein [Desulfosarcina ovata]|uniref:Iron-sulfur cluster carrier protein n=2 Tax=Desulfosarcina ovata TaxID=83564 RepID=A0A5K8A3E0_9BACT|nr:Mrp/NBP35 family ATP-binding protein [Desulfosarcina ovata]BBO79580.1 iron-sulfur cluster carrier protein [Desulfosarcina ovata subsp. sediminis]BBO86987.1 iron-sulfur cluster carrier protein [Desulfosarcina ovata subsp. ovata]